MAFKAPACLAAELASGVAVGTHFCTPGAAVYKHHSMKIANIVGDLFTVRLCWCVLENCSAQPLWATPEGVASWMTCCLKHVKDITAALKIPVSNAKRHRICFPFFFFRFE